MENDKDSINKLDTLTDEASDVYTDLKEDGYSLEEIAAIALLRVSLALQLIADRSNE